MTDGHSSQETVRDGELHPTAISGHALVLVNDAGLRVVPLPASGALVVGRGSDADVRVADNRMSRRHLRLRVDGAFSIEDLHSANGTVVNGRALAPGEPRALGAGDTIIAGTTTMLIRARSYSTTSPDDPPAPPVVSRAMSPVLELADRAAASTISVLLLGETGVGKDVLAERIHRRSPRGDGPFVRLNCAAFSSTLLASELFGHEKGAFTGASSARPGLLQSAGGGTVFLDEVGDLPLEHQAKLLLVIERREVIPIGSVRPRPLDVRFLFATNRDLPQDVEAGTFRRDLYFRLNGITIEVPPLRARVPEIGPLAQRFALDAARAIGKPAPELPRETIALLERHRWPGNIRELRSVIERAVLLAPGTTLAPADLALSTTAAVPLVPPAQSTAVGPRPGEGGDTEDGSADSAERRRIAETLASCGGNQSRAAKLLGMSRNALIARIVKYGFTRPLSRRSPP